MSLHIYVSRKQPATRVYYGPELGIKPFWQRCSPRTLFRCHSCNSLRWASKINVQVYYDGNYQSCRDRIECARRRKQIALGESHDAPTLDR